MLQGRDLEPVLHVDAELGLGEIDLELLADLGRMAPFGAGNPALTFVSRGLVIKSRSVIGRERVHLRLVIADASGNTQEAVWWRAGDQPLPEGRFDLAYRLGLNDYQGRKTVQLTWLDYQRVEEPAGAADRRRRLEVNDYRRSSEPRGEPDPLIAEGPSRVGGGRCVDEGTQMGVVGEDRRGHGRGSGRGGDRWARGALATRRRTARRAALGALNTAAVSHAPWMSGKTAISATTAR